MKKHYKYKEILKIGKILFQVLVLANYICLMVFPQYALATTIQPKQTYYLPDSELKIPLEEKYVVVTAYSSTVDQTDSTPFITANGARVGWGLVAANFLPFNSRVSFPEYFGDQIFVVKDRTNLRFSDRIDIWFPTREEALEFGKRSLKVEIWK